MLKINEKFTVFFFFFFSKTLCYHIFNTLLRQNNSFCGDNAKKLYVKGIIIMKSKKIISSILAFMLVCGTFTVLPDVTDGAVSTAITASADTVGEYYKTVNGFVLNKDEYGYVYVSNYTGNGGNITIPKEATYIGESAFAYNTSITSVNFPAGTTKYGIQAQAFEYCTNLTSVTIGGDIGQGEYNGICGSAFKCCYSLSKVSFSKKDAYVAFIDGYAFFSCYALKSINLPSNTQKIWDYAFVNCASLQSITIPEKTQIDGSYTFGYMYGTKTADDFYSSTNDDTKKRSLFRADGKTAVYWELYVEMSAEASVVAKRAFGTDAGLVWWWYSDNMYKPYSFIYPLKQKAITLNVTAGSPAEKWAKNHKIKYKSTAAAPAVGDVLDAPSNLDATKTKNSVTLVWDDVTGASAYRVYKYDTKTKKYVKYKDVSASKCKITGLAANTKYKFKVVALKKNGSKYTEGEYATISVTTKK